MSIIKMQIPIVILPKTLFPWHTSDNVTVSWCWQFSGAQDHQGSKLILKCQIGFKST